MVKEKLLNLTVNRFPERQASTLDYDLSEDERSLYEAVTEYVRAEFNTALTNCRVTAKGTVGFCVDRPQGRLASSPEAIYQSLQRRRNGGKEAAEWEQVRRKFDPNADTPI